MLKKTFTLEHTLYALALAIALGLRFLHLGALPLSDFEADWALQSLGIVNGLKPALGPNPGYIHLTAVLFAIFGASDFWARFWPALAGSGLVLAPWFVRSRIGRLPALVLAFGLALDPGLNALSRLAGGPMLAIAFLALTLVLWLDGRRAAAGLFAGLALLSGPSVWFGVFGLLLAWAAAQLLPSGFRGMTSAVETEPGGGAESVRPQSGLYSGQGLTAALSWGLGTLLVVGSLLVFSPQGLAAFVKSFAVFFSNWWTLSDVPLGRVFLALPAYELLPLVFGLVGLVRGLIKRDAVSIKLSLWALAALLLVVVCVGRQVADLGWALLPLWALAAVELGRHFDFSSANRWVVGGVITFIFVLLVLSWLTLANLTLLDPISTQARLQWVFIGGIALVIAIALVLVGSGWTVNEAWLGGVWGVLLPLALFTLAMTTGAAGVRKPRTLELWNPEPRLGRADLVLKVANEISNLNTGYDAQLPLAIVGVDSPALRWLFRDWEVEESDIFAPEATPELVITPFGVDLTLTADYRGEPLVWREVGDWYNATFVNWLNWFVYRQMPVLREDIILWVRADLLLDNQGLPTP
ncbi:MAG: hypothetical protein HY781_04705 [Chloroflexi bacterium]|nr:hypothetical protein [Chloroflexota bacterium]